MDEIEQPRNYVSDDQFISNIYYEMSSEMEISGANEDVDDMNLSYLSIFSSPFTSSEKLCILSPTKLIANNIDENFATPVDSTSSEIITIEDLSLKDNCSTINIPPNTNDKKNNRIEFRLSGRTLGGLQRLSNSNPFQISRQHSEYHKICINSNSGVSNNRQFLRSISESSKNILSKNMASRNLFSDVPTIRNTTHTINRKTQETDKIEEKEKCRLATMLKNTTNNNSQLCSRILDEKNVDIKCTPPQYRRLSMPNDISKKTTSPIILRRRRTISKFQTNNFKIIPQSFDVYSTSEKISILPSSNHLNLISSTPKRKFNQNISSTPERKILDTNLNDSDTKTKYNICNSPLSPLHNSFTEQMLFDLQISIETPSKNLINDENFCLSPLMLTFNGEEALPTSNHNNQLDCTNINQRKEQKENGKDSYRKVACGNSKASHCLIDLAHQYIHTQSSP